MKLPLSWLKEYILTELSAEKIAEALTLLGLEVDGIETSPLAFEGVVVGEVRSCRQHPEADKLKIATVFDGQEEWEVVCAAPNCRTGLKSAFARIGARIQGKKIKKGKLRGIVSHGMLCSEQELGIGDESDGIAELDLPVGQDLAAVYGDTIFDISLTPNLGHCASVLGVARELAALTGEMLTPPPLPKVEESADSIPVKNIGCPRYACRTIRGVKVHTSPKWLKERVEACGMRSINNIVDVVNLIMLETGQPMHAFDLAHLNGPLIVVRPSKPGESLKTLDGVERRLDAETLVIADAKGPIALAGVMGGGGSEVGDETCDLVLESAYFRPSAVRQTSKATLIVTESSKRFERGSDPEQVLPALDKASALIQSLAGGSTGKIVDLYENPIPLRRLTLRTERTNRVLGTALSKDEIEKLLARLGFEVDNEIIVPSYRSDVTTEIDLIEEVARLYGFANIPKRAARYTPSEIPHTPLFLFEQEVRAGCIAQGLTECVTNTLVGPETDGVKVVNPGSIEHSVLRTSLFPGLLQVAEHNARQRNHNITAFEIGQVHLARKEESHCALLLCGDQMPFHFSKKGESLDFLDAKGILENLLHSLCVGPAKFKPSHHSHFHPGRQATLVIEGNNVGLIAEVHPNIRKDLFFAELHLDQLIDLRLPKQAMPLSQFPGSDRDWTISLAEEVTIDEVLAAIEQVPSRLLKNILLIGIYRSDSIGTGWKNTTFRFYYRDDRKTVAQKAVEAEHQRIISSVTQQVRCQS